MMIRAEFANFVLYKRRSRRPASLSNEKSSLMIARNNEPTAKERRNRFIIGWMWKLFLLAFVSMVVFFLLVYNGWIGYMPPVKELKNPNDKFATVVYTADGEEMGRYYRNSGNRVYADYNEISQHVIDALIATEDARFEDHSGIDLRAVMRVLVKTVIMQQKNAGGGSDRKSVV